MGCRGPCALGVFRAGQDGLRLGSMAAPARARGGVRGRGLGTSVGGEVMAGVPPDPARLPRASDPGLGRRVSVEVERTVDAPMERVWTLLRDYRVARPRLLSEHFSEYGVRERGERGEGARHGDRLSAAGVA